METPQISSLDMQIESNRLKTFDNWPNPYMSPSSLAKAGFYYLNRSDEVKCAWCKGVIAKWERQDNPWDEHQRFFPECPRVQLGPLIEVTNDGIRDLGIHQISPPKKPQFSSLDARLRTYSDWPIPDIQKPDKLAEAGLYYQNIDDHVRCFHCSIGLRSWQKEDDPWFEHAKWYPECQFVRLVKGPLYIQQVQDAVRQSAAANSIHSNISIEDAMNSSPVLQALEMGVDVGAIKNVTQNQLLTAGRPFRTVEDLLKAVFGDENSQNESEITDQNLQSEEELGTNSIAQEMSRLLRNTFGLRDNANSQALTEITDATNINIIEGDPPSTDFQTVIIKTSPSISNINLESSISSEQATLNDKPSAAGCAHHSLEEENRRLKDARLCKICLDEEVGVVFLPCGHLVTCVQCANGVHQCPMCRTGIKGFVRTYLS